MTVTVYRLAKLRYQKQIFSGTGGLHAHGRWTMRGLPVVYASESISLAVLEYTLNYRRRGWVPPSVLGRVSIPDAVAIEVVDVTGLPSRWSDPDPPPALREIGQGWLERRRTAVLKVPSAVIVEEWNYLLNPQHGDFGKLVPGKPRQFQFDLRLARTRKR